MSLSWFAALSRFKAMVLMALDEGVELLAD